MKSHTIPKFAAIALFSVIGLCQGARAQTAAQQEACAADYQSFCVGVMPGGGRILACLKKNEAKLSPECKKAMTGAKPAQ